jgi:hypothetical protein
MDGDQQKKALGTIFNRRWATFLVVAGFIMPGSRTEESTRMRMLVIAISATLLAGNARAQVAQGPTAERGTGASVAAAILVADRIPTLNVRKACQNSTIGTDPCVTDEQAARQMLTEKWSSFPARDKASCENQMRTVDRTISYIDLLDCLLIDAHAREPSTPTKGQSSPTKAQ